MSAANPLTHFPVSSLHTKLNHRISFPHSISKSPCFQRRVSSQRLLLSRELPSGLSSNSRKVRSMALGSGDGEEKSFGVFEQEAFVDGSPQIPSDFASADFEATLNRVSKWVVAGLYAGVFLWRHDGEAAWAAIGSVLNSALSVVLKRILNQERPVAHLRSDPGMPSSHAQSFFYLVTFIILSMVESLGVNQLTLILSAITLALGSYLSWLRVSQKLHTLEQVLVGGVLGSCFCLLWIWSWHTLVLDAFNSNLWLQISVFVGFAIFGLCFIIHVVRNWFTTE